MSAPETGPLLRTPLYQHHLSAGAKMSPFGGWDMPLHYGSQVSEHHAVRQSVGMFDVSHMGQVVVEGANAFEFLQRCVMNDVAALTTDGRAQYSPLCQDDGGMIDDLIVTRLGENRYFVVVNASTQIGDFAHMQEVAKRFHLVGPNLTLRLESESWGMIAVQGPRAESMIASLIPKANAREIGYYHLRETEWDGARALVSRTGYTGEDGFEVMLPPKQTGDLWDALMALGVQPCGLGARDTLRLEAGYLLYGQDMTTATNPIHASLGWACKEKKAIAPVGGDAVARERGDKGGPRIVGVQLTEAGIPRHDTPVMCGEQTTACGKVTSGTFSPTIQKGIALAMVNDPSVRGVGARVRLQVRGRDLAGQVTKPPFVPSRVKK